MYMDGMTDEDVAQLAHLYPDLPPPPIDPRYRAEPIDFFDYEDEVEEWRLMLEQAKRRRAAERRASARERLYASGGTPPASPAPTTRPPLSAHAERSRLEVGLAIRAARARLRMAQGDLATRAGMSRSTLSRIEYGRQLPTIDQLIRVAEALGEPPSAFLPPDEANRPP